MVAEEIVGKRDGLYFTANNVKAFYNQAQVAQAFCTPHITHNMTYTLSPTKLLEYTPVDKLGRENVGQRLRLAGKVVLWFAYNKIHVCYMLIIAAVAICLVM